MFSSRSCFRVKRHRGLWILTLPNAARTKKQRLFASQSSKRSVAWKSEDHDTHISWKKSMCGGCKISRADNTCINTGKRTKKQNIKPGSEENGRNWWTNTKISGQPWGVRMKETQLEGPAYIKAMEGAQGTMENWTNSEPTDFQTRLGLELGGWTTYVVVFKETQHLQLAEYSLGRHQRLEHVGHLLQSHALAVSRIRDRPAKSNPFVSQDSTATFSMQPGL